MKEVSCKREIWVDNVKVIACVLVVLGHFIQGLSKPGILKLNDFYCWFNDAIYYFHVPLFFICSGYLYQKTTVIDNVKVWSSNIAKKLLVLGVPFLTFSFATWLMKTVFSSSINGEAGGLFEVLFTEPSPPYWYLYTLFFIFVVTPTFSGKKQMLCWCSGAIILNIIFMVSGESISVLPFAIRSVMRYEIWFVIGMVLEYVGAYAEVVKNKSKYVMTSVTFGSVFIALSILIYINKATIDIMSFILGLMACFSIIFGMMVQFSNGRQNKIFGILVEYTMPIFLMHTIFAGAVRSILMKIGIFSMPIHVIIGLCATFGGPIVVAMIMKRIKGLEFFMYPGKFIKMKDKFN